MNKVWINKKRGTAGKKLLTFMAAGLWLVVFSVCASAFSFGPAQSAIANTPQGIRFVVPDQVTGKVSIYNASSFTTAAKAGEISTGGAVYGVVFSPDGTKAYISVDRSSTSYPYIGVIDFSGSSSPGSATEILLDSMARDPRGIAISPNGKYVFVADETGVVHVLDTATATIIGRISVGSGYLLNGVAVKPDGTRLAVSRREAAGYVYIYDITNITSASFSLPTSTTASIGSSIWTSSGRVTLKYPTYVAWGESNDANATETYLYVKVRTEEVSRADAFIFNSDDDSYGTYSDQATSVCLGDVGVSKNFASDGADGYNGLALSANRLVGYLSVYNSSSTKPEAYHFDASQSSLGLTYVDAASSTLSGIDSLAGSLTGTVLWFGFSNDAKAGGHEGSETGFSSTSLTAPTILYPEEDTTGVTTGFAWSAVSGATYYDVDYILASDINTNNWTGYSSTITDTSVTLASMGLASSTSYYLRVRAIKGASFSADTCSAFSYVGPFTTGSVVPDGIKIIDDYDGSNVDPTIGSSTSYGYNNAGLSGASLSLTDVDSDGDNEMQVSYSSSAISGQWVATIKNSAQPIDISAYNAIALDIKGDGSSNTFQIGLIEQGTGYTWLLPAKISLVSTSWQTVVISLAGAYVSGGADSSFSGQVDQYVVIYDSGSAGSSSHCLDNIRAIDTTSSAVPGPVLDLTLLMHGYYNVGTSTQVVATVEVEARSAASADLANEDAIIMTFSGLTLNDSGRFTEKLPYLPDGSYFIVVRQVIAGAPRNANHLAVMGSTALSMIDGITSALDFSAAGVVYDSADAEEGDPMYYDATATRYLMRVGDAGGSASTAVTDEYINSYDFELWLPNDSQASSVSPQCDFNGDGFINSTDFEFWMVNDSTGTNVPTKTE